MDRHVYMQMLEVSEVSKMNELECLVSEKNIDIVGISETWWDEDNYWDIVSPGYNLYWKGREEESEVEWVCMSEMACSPVKLRI